jgi:hypothetical protein
VGVHAPVEIDHVEVFHNVGKLPLPPGLGFREQALEFLVAEVVGPTSSTPHRIEFEEHGHASPHQEIEAADVGTERGGRPQDFRADHRVLNHPAYQPVGVDPALEALRGHVPQVDVDPIAHHGPVIEHLVRQDIGPGEDRVAFRVARVDVLDGEDALVVPVFSQPCRALRQ